jgi:hypothetical protein
VVLEFDKMGLRRKRSSCSQGQSSSLLAVACILLLAVPISALNSLPVENPLPLGIGQSKGQNQPNSNSNPVAIHQPYPDRQPLGAQTVETGNKAKVAIIGRPYSHIEIESFIGNESTF